MEEATSNKKIQAAFGIWRPPDHLCTRSDRQLRVLADPVKSSKLAKTFSEAPESYGPLCLRANTRVRRSTLSRFCGKRGRIELDYRDTGGADKVSSSVGLHRIVHRNPFGFSRVGAEGRAFLGHEQ